MSEQTRVKVDPSTGSVEVEGPEPFVREMLKRYEHLTQKAPPPEPSTPSATKKQTTKKTKKPAAGKPGATKKAGKPSTPELDKELQKQLRSNLQDLKSTFASRLRLSHQEEAAVIAWFLDENLNRGVLNASAYFTTLRVLNRKLPQAVQQVLTDAKNKRNFFDEVDGGFSLASPGINFATKESLKEQESGAKAT